MSEQPSSTPVSRRLSSVKNIIIVLSGKGGVGKSSSAVQLALSSLNTGPNVRVGLLDSDSTGPSLPRMVGSDDPSATVKQSSAGWVPVYVDKEGRSGVMSIGFSSKNRGDSVVWRGPKKDGMIRQFLQEVRWGDLDYLVIDTPPGTTDEHISLSTHSHPSFTPTAANPTTPTAVMVTTPQKTAINDTIKSVSFTRKLGSPVSGVVENMAGYACPCCHEISACFGKGGGEDMAKDQGLEFLGSVPIDTKSVDSLDAVSKGEMPGEGAKGEDANESAAESGAQAEAKTGDPAGKDGESNGQSNGHTEQFPSLDRYNETTSARVWKDIAGKAVDDINRRRGEISAKLQAA